MDRGLVELPARAGEFRLVLRRLGFVALHVEAVAGAGPRQLARLPEARLRERELRLKFLDLQPVGRRVDAKQHLTLLHRAVALGRNVDHHAAHLRVDLHHVIDDAHVRG